PRFERMRAEYFIERGGERMRVHRTELVRLPRALIGAAWEINAREAPDGRIYRAVVRSRETNRGQVKSPTVRRHVLRADETVIAVPHVERRRRVDRVHIINHALARDELERGAGGDVVEIIIVETIALIPAPTTEEPMLLTDAVINADSVVIVPLGI